MNGTMKVTGTTIALAAALTMAACALDQESEGSDDYYEGVAFDAENPGASVGGAAADGSGYAVPTDLPTLVAPEVIVSLDGLTLHLFDRQTGFSEVYPVGVGVLNQDGLSVTPTGHFATGPDTSDTWFYIARRYLPADFGGFPFIRLTAENSEGENTYGLHGPITDRLIRGYVSHGCVRMEGEDVVRLFYMVRRHASTPVTIQREVERDADGRVVDVGVEAALFGPDDAIPYGESVDDPPPRDETGTDADGCADDRFESDSPVPLEPGNTYGLILCAGDVDLYTVSLAAGQSLAAHIHFVHQISDLDLRLLDPAGRVVDEDLGVGDDASVEGTADAAGVYVIEVSHGAEGESNGYSIGLAID